MDLNEFCRKLEVALVKPEQSLHPYTAFADIDGFDSMAQIEVLLLLSDMYGVQLQESEIRQLEHISDVEQFVVEKRGAGVE